MLAVEAFAAESLHVDGYSVSRLHVGYLLSHFFNNAHHLMANGNPWYCTRHRTMLDMKVAGADTAQRYSHDGIMRIYYHWLLLLSKTKLSLLDISKYFHWILFN